VWRRRSGNKDQPVEAKHVNCLTPEDQMPVVDRIEGSTENANSFQNFIPRPRAK
jgi:hypothetical protein